MDERQAQFDWTFGLWWMVTCALGTVVGGLMAFTSMWTVWDAVNMAANEMAAGLVGGLLFGAMLALGANLGPGLLLRGKGVDGGRWIGYSVLAGAAGIGGTLAITFSFTDNLPEAAGVVAIALALGLPVGLAQWWVLQRSSFAAAEWPVISTAAYLLMAAVIFASSEDSGMALWLILMGLILGAVTALGMVWVRRQRTVIA